MFCGFSSLEGRKGNLCMDLLFVKIFTLLTSLKPTIMCLNLMPANGRKLEVMLHLRHNAIKQHRRSFEVWCPRHPGASTIGSQLQDGDCTDGWQNLTTGPHCLLRHFQSSATVQTLNSNRLLFKPVKSLIIN